MDKSKEVGKRVRPIQGRASASVAYMVAVLESGRLETATARAWPEHERVMMRRKLHPIVWQWGQGQKGIFIRRRAAKAVL